MASGALRSALRHQLSQIDAFYERLHARELPSNHAGTESFAFQLYNIYCAFEELFEIVAAYCDDHARAFAAARADGSGRITPLQRMSVPVEGVRPALISDRSRALLEELQRFHASFLRARGYLLEDRKVSRLVQDAKALEEHYRPEVLGFLEALESASQVDT